MSTCPPLYVRGRGWGALSTCWRVFCLPLKGVFSTHEGGFVNSWRGFCPPCKNDEKDFVLRGFLSVHHLNAWFAKIFYFRYTLYLHCLILPLIGPRIFLILRRDTRVSCNCSRWEKGACLYFFCFRSVIHFFPHHPLFLAFLFSTGSSVTFFPFSERQHKMTHKGWHAINITQTCL